MAIYDSIMYTTSDENVIKCEMPNANDYSIVFFESNVNGSSSKIDPDLLSIEIFRSDGGNDPKVINMR